MLKIVVLQTPAREYLAEETKSGEITRALVRNTAENSFQWNRLPDPQKVINGAKSVFEIKKKNAEKEHLEVWSKNFST